MTDTPATALVDRLRSHFGARALTLEVTRGEEATLEVAAADLIAVATALRDEPAFRFGELIDLCGLDYLSYGSDEWDTTDVSSEGFSRGVEGLGPGRFKWGQQQGPDGRDNDAARFAVRVVHLLSVENNQRLRLRVFCEDDTLPVVPSLTLVWPGLNWFERETFDLFGIVFDGHPDLRRLLTDYGFVGHPFRKDFPLIGNVEVRYDPEKKRVVYEPVSIEPRVLVPRVIRDDSRYATAAGEAAQRSEVKK